MSLPNVSMGDKSPILVYCVWHGSNGKGKMIQKQLGSVVEKSKCEISYQKYQGLSYEYFLAIKRLG